MTADYTFKATLVVLVADPTDRLAVYIECLSDTANVYRRLGANDDDE
jgi:hypothetical protein